MNRRTCFAKFALAAAALPFAALAHGQSDLLPTGQYPQFRTLSGLPGGGFGVRPDGSTGFDGAMSFSTPIGYSLTSGHYAVVGSNTSDNLLFRFPHLSGDHGHDDSNGKLDGLAGFSLGQFGSCTGTFVIDSSALDHSFNFVYQPLIKVPNLGVAVGVQDIVGHRGIGGTGRPGADTNSQSLFTAATYSLPRGIFVSAGLGNRRFNHGFVNASAPLIPRFKLVLEHDGFNVNEALAFDTGSFGFKDQKIQSSLMAGFVRSKYAFFSFNLSL